MQRNAARGFTLIELLVTTSIVVVLLGSGVPAFRQFGRVQQLELGADQIKSSLLDTRGYALNPRSQKDNTNSNTDCVSSNLYTIEFIQGNSNYRITEGNCLVSTGTLPSSIFIKSSPGPISFSVTKQGRIELPPCTVPNACNPAVVIGHDQMAATATRTISVNRETGVVSISK